MRQTQKIIWYSMIDIKHHRLQISSIHIYSKAVIRSLIQLSLRKLRLGSAICACHYNFALSIIYA